jgi:hypothetical protein
MTPTKDQISKVIAASHGDPRKIAIAYLRAKKRADDAEKAFRLLDDITTATDSVRDGNGKEALEILQKTLRDLNANEVKK